jgi:hypothetical protein
MTVKRKKVAKSLLLVTVVFILIIIGYLFYQSSRVVECGRITDEMECFKKPSCKGAYGPSSCSGGICTADEAFKKCVEKTEWEIENELKLKKECEDQGLTFEIPGPLSMPTCK